MGEDFDETRGACRAWRKCLRKSKQEQHVLTLLGAAGAGDASAYAKAPATVSADAPPAEAPGDRCVNPALEDPESWNCDCWDNMHSRCQMIAGGTKGFAGERGLAPAFVADCIRAQFCLYPPVCASWLDVYC